ncbi:MAG TPA: TIGR01777 family oxidoreductase [Candidatus Binataceae bacterium]|nr:TIGR01777 family oxidoreductase [Candidatus Binataceae bacterium]
MRVFVTGATGFIGRALTLRLLGGRHEVSAWVRAEDRARNLLGPQVRLVTASGGQQALSAEMARADAVVNLAGEPILGGRWTAQRRQALRQSRIDLTNSIVDAIRQSDRRPAVLVSASAVGYYGDQGDEVLDEQSAPGDDFLARVCKEWEQAALRAEEAGVRVFIPRFGIVLGLDGGALSQMLPPFRFGAGGPIASGRQRMSWIHVFDLVEIIAAALEDGRCRGPANAVALSSVSNRDFARALGRVLHRPSFVPVPTFALRAMFGEGASVLTASQNAQPRRLSELGFRWRFENVEAALRNILAEDDPEIGPLDANTPKFDNPNGSSYPDKQRPNYLLLHKASVNAPLGEVFSFFSHPQNLAVMTPADMRFQITGATPAEMSAGTRIEYKLQVGPLPMLWRTLIEVWQPQRLFIDSQEKGPYRCWWHEHHFKPDGASTLMEDRVYFAPPFGILGAAAGHFLVMPALRRIFRFRAQAMQLRFRRTS